MEKPFRTAEEQVDILEFDVVKDEAFTRAAGEGQGVREPGGATGALTGGAHFLAERPT